MPNPSHNITPCRRIGLGRRSQKKCPDSIEKCLNKSFISTDDHEKEKTNFTTDPVDSTAYEENTKIFISTPNRNNNGSFIHSRKHKLSLSICKKMKIKKKFQLTLNHSQEELFSDSQSCDKGLTKTSVEVENKESVINIENLKENIVLWQNGFIEALSLLIDKIDHSQNVDQILNELNISSKLIRFDSSAFKFLD